MIKMRQKETATNLVYFYNLDTIKSLDELGVWFVGVSSISDLTIRRTQREQVLLKLILRQQETIQPTALEKFMQTPYL